MTPDDIVILFAALTLGADTALLGLAGLCNVWRR